MCCLDYARVGDNETTDRLTGNAAVVGTMMLDKDTVT